MALGELLYDKSLFSGFLTKPKLWLGVFFETSVATIMMTGAGALIRSRLYYLRIEMFALASFLVWSLLGLLLIFLYSHFYWTREWHLTSIAPGLLFGWIAPCFRKVVASVRNSGGEILSISENASDLFERVQRSDC